MKKLLILLFTAVVALSANAQSSDALNFLNRVKTYLSNEGYRPEIDSDGDLAFKVEGKTYWIRVNKEDAGYYQVRYFYNLGCKDAEFAAVLMAVNDVNKEYKVGRCYYDDDEVVLKIDGFYASASDFTKYFSRYTAILTGMVKDAKDYYEKYENALGD